MDTGRALVHENMEGLAMVSAIAGSSYLKNPYADKLEQQRIIPRDLKGEAPKDTLILGKSGSVSSDQAMGVVFERAMDKLRSVVSDARQALGMADNAQIDTSPDATGNRIADFALGAFDKWRTQHKDLADDVARKQFADFIGGAVQQGIEEARGILGALNALSNDVSSNIDKTWNTVQQRLNDFVGSAQ
jgi:hypothetical protein